MRTALGGRPCRAASLNAATGSFQLRRFLLLQRIATQQLHVGGLVFATLCERLDVVDLAPLRSPLQTLGLQELRRYPEVVRGGS